MIELFSSLGLVTQIVVVYSILTICIILSCTFIFSTSFEALILGLFWPLVIPLVIMYTAAILTIYIIVAILETSDQKKTVTLLEAMNKIDLEKI